MTDANYTHYVLIVDRSGSMTAVREDTEGGIAYFVQEQQQLSGKATLSLYQFDHGCDLVHDFVPLAEVPRYTLAPRGRTALLDACGFAITGTGGKLAAMPEGQRPGKVVVLIATDGKENFSREYTKARVNELVTRQREEYSWQFTYIGANQDSFAEAGAIGVPAHSTMDWLETSAGTQGAWASASAAACRYAGGWSANISYTPKERAAAMGEGE